MKEDTSFNELKESILKLSNSYSQQIDIIFYPVSIKLELLKEIKKLSPYKSSLSDYGVGIIGVELREYEDNKEDEVISKYINNFKKYYHREPKIVKLKRYK